MASNSPTEGSSSYPATPQTLEACEGMRTPSPGAPRKYPGAKPKSQGPRPQSPSAEEQCSICLERIENKSHTDSCNHLFCFTCILEWSKVKPQCPQCRKSFKKIIHTIQSENEYKTHTLPERPAVPRPRGEIEVLDHLGPAAEALNLGNLGPNWVQAQHRIQQLLMNQYQMHQHLPGFNPMAHELGHILPVGPAVDRNRRDELRNRAERRRVASTDFRRSVYERAQYVRPESVTDVTGRFRDSSPSWYRANPAQTHRLVPWLNRELNALMSQAPHQVPHVLQQVLELIERYPISGHEFRLSMELYLDTRTAHFQHEFHNFARSVYDMVGYDRVAEYGPAPEDVFQPQQLPLRPEHVAPAQRAVETLELSSEDDENDQAAAAAVPSTSSAAPSGSSNPDHPAAPSADSGPSVSDRPGILPYYSLAEIQISDNEDDDDNDGIEFVQQVQVPKRTPEVIDIPSSPEHEAGKDDWAPFRGRISPLLGREAAEDAMEPTRVDPSSPSTSSQVGHSRDRHGAESKAHSSHASHASHASRKGKGKGKRSGNAGSGRGNGSSSGESDPLVAGRPTMTAMERERLEKRHREKAEASLWKKRLSDAHKTTVAAKKQRPICFKSETEDDEGLATESTVTQSKRDGETSSKLPIWRPYPGGKGKQIKNESGSSSDEPEPSGAIRYPVAAETTSVEKERLNGHRRHIDKERNRSSQSCDSDENKGRKNWRNKGRHTKLCSSSNESEPSGAVGVAVADKTSWEKKRLESHRRHRDKHRKKHSPSHDSDENQGRKKHRKKENVPSKMEDGSSSKDFAPCGNVKARPEEVKTSLEKERLEGHRRKRDKDRDRRSPSCDSESIEGRKSWRKKEKGKLSKVEDSSSSNDAGPSGNVEASVLEVKTSQEAERLDGHQQKQDKDRNRRSQSCDSEENLPLKKRRRLLNEGFYFESPASLVKEKGKGKKSKGESWRRRTPSGKRSASPSNKTNELENKAKKKKKKSRKSPKKRRRSEHYYSSDESVVAKKQRKRKKFLDRIDSTDEESEERVSVRSKVVTSQLEKGETPSTLPLWRPYLGGHSGNAEGEPRAQSEKRVVSMLQTDDSEDVPASLPPAPERGSANYQEGTTAADQVPPAHGPPGTHEESVIETSRCDPPPPPARRISTSTVSTSGHSDLSSSRRIVVMDEEEEEERPLAAKRKKKKKARRNNSNSKGGSEDLRLTLNRKRALLSAD